MDRRSMSTDLADPAVSPEPSSTRPNPFDDGDIASRKRRRTSLSNSPTTTLDPTKLAHESPVPPTIDTDMTAPDDVSKPEGDPTKPRTPEQQSGSPDPPTQAPSSMVTINLRNALPDELVSPSSASPSPNAPASPSGATTDSINASVGELEVNLVPTSGEAMHTPQPSSLAPESPVIEVITMPDDDEMSFDEPGTGVSIVGDDQLIANPVQDFPYNDPDEGLVETLHRLIHYISTQTSLDDSFLNALRSWLERYLEYTRESGQQAVWEACRQYRPFWMVLPDMIFAMTSRKNCLLKAHYQRNIVMPFYYDFARLTAWFVAVDCRTIQEMRAGRAQHDRSPDLFSPAYLQQLHTLTQVHGPFEKDSDAELASHEPEDSARILRKLQTCPGGSLNGLSQLANLLIDFAVPNFPRLVDSLVPICQVSADIMRESLSNLLIGRGNGLVSKQRLELGHRLYDKVSNTLAEAIEKHVTHLNSDNVFGQINALTEMLKYGLCGDSKLAADALAEHRQRFPDLPPKFTPEAIVWEKRFDVLIKLIRSSQMQLRVMAVTTMCTDLVSRWKGYNDAGEDGSIIYLNHLADYLLRTGLIEYILSPSCHPEITVESANIIGFLVVTKKYLPEHTNLLWQGITSSQDPRIAEALARMVATITNLFDYGGLLGLCEKLQTLPIDGFTPAMRHLWENILRGMITRANLDGTTLSLHPYNLCLRLLRDSSICASGSQVAHPEMQNLAMQRLRDLLSYGPDHEGRNQLYLNCIADISEKSRTTLGSLWCLSLAIRPMLASELRLLTGKHDLTRLIADELEHAVETARAEGVSMVLDGALNQPRRDFISNIICLEPLTVDDEIGKKLWDILVGERSLCLDDRRAGWHVLIAAVRRSSFKNPFIQKCFSAYLQTLPPAYFCDGMLDFVRDEITPRLKGTGDLVLDDQDLVSKSGIEQLWRIILEANDGELVDNSVRTLAIDIYLESQSILNGALQRNRQIHVSLVNRCLRQLKEAAQKITTSRYSTPSADDASMIIVPSEEQIQAQERIFIRSLKLIHFFLENHRARPRFAAPDVRTLITQAPYEIEGDSAELKYQSFDGHQQTEVRPLSIGKLNTAASLLASIRLETGFENYRVFYRGQPFAPTEQDICKSLEDLRVHDGLILVKREEDIQSPPVQIKPGASALEIEVSAHFDELWEYLSMEEGLAQEVYHFLVKLPTNGHVLQALEDHEISYRDLFPPGQPFKSLYAVHALVDNNEATCRRMRMSMGESSASSAPLDVLKRSISLIVQAISDEDVLDRASEGLRLKLSSSLMHAYLRAINIIPVPNGSSKLESLEVPASSRLVDILSIAAACTNEGSFSLISSTLATILQLGVHSAPFWEDLKSSPTFSSLIHNLLFDSRKGVRATVAKQIEDVVILEENHSQAEMDPASTQEDAQKAKPLMQYLWTIVSELIPETVIMPTHCDEGFRVACALLAMITSSSHNFVDVPRLASSVGQILLDHTSIEDIGRFEVEDMVAKGLVSLLLLALRASDSVSSALPPNFVRDLFYKQLYPKMRKHTEDLVPKVIQSGDTRAKLSEVLFTLVKGDPLKIRLLLEDIDGLVPYYEHDEDDPYLYDLPHQFERSKALRSPCGYAGLQNLSNTCYLNSLLTQLFMNTNFREFILMSKLRDPTNTQQLLFNTQKLFSHMQDSYRRYIDPSNLVNVIKTYDDTPIDIHNQMDVDEFYNLLFDRWEGQMTSNAERKKLRSFYGGQLVQQVKSMECDHISERLEPFSAIQCDIKGKSTLEESLQAYVDGEIMEGDNKYKCSTCDRHVDAVKRACLKDIPDNVIFHLKRFDFSLRTLQRNKINDYFSFPKRVDLRPYTIEHLSSGSDATSAEDEDIFELVGVLVHSGTAESGHYYSYIRERPTSRNGHTWVEFNDDMVTPWDPAQMEGSTFGGPDNRPPYDANGAMYDKTYSAYMLFYQRASSLKTGQENMCLQNAASPLRVNVPRELREHILDENTVILRRHCVFDPNHMQLVQRLFEHTSAHCERGSMDVDVSMVSNGNGVTDGSRSAHGLRELAMRASISHLDQVVSREKDTPYVESFFRSISEAVILCHNCAFAFYDYFHKRPGAFRALLQRHPDHTIRAFTGKTLIRALGRISNSLPQLYDPERARQGSLGSSNDSVDSQSLEHLEPESSVLEGTMLIFNHLWRYFHVSIRSWDDYFNTMLGFGKLGHREAAFLLAEDYLIKSIRILSADPMIDLPTNYAKMLHNVLRRINSRPPSYVAIIALINHLMQQLVPDLGPEAIVDSPAERLDSLSRPFSWTAEEVQAVHYGLEDDNSSLFVEKLLSIDQAPESSDEIVRRLIRTGPQMDMRVLSTLKRNIRSDTSQPLDPFLRAATVYIETTRSVEHATKTVQHICLQARNLQGTEGAYFIAFAKTALGLKRSEDDIAGAVRDFSLRLIPKWAPYLLVYSNDMLRRQAEEVLESQLFRCSSLITPTDQDAVQDRADLIRPIIRQLGVACLGYLHENHVRRREQLGQGGATLILRVISKCAAEYERDPAKQDGTDVEFMTMQSEVLDPLRRLIVDDIEDDGSDWEGSCGSSERLDDLVEMSAHALDDTNDVNLA